MHVQRTNNHKQREGMDERDRLLDLLAERSFRIGDFTLASGRKSRYYVDARTTTLSRTTISLGSGMTRSVHPFKLLPSQAALAARLDCVNTSETTVNEIPANALYLL